MDLDSLEFVKTASMLKNAYIDQWKKENKQVVGYYCSYIPEELIHALGMLPFRIRGKRGGDTAGGDRGDR